MFYPLWVFPMSIQAQESESHVGSLSQLYPMQPPSPVTAWNEPLLFNGPYHGPGPGCDLQPAVTHGHESQVSLSMCLYGVLGIFIWN